MNFGTDRKYRFKMAASRSFANFNFIGPPFELVIERNFRFALKIFFLYSLSNDVSVIGGSRKTSFGVGRSILRGPKSFDTLLSDTSLERE